MIKFKEAVDGRHYFTIVANNHETVGNPSQMYDFPSGAKAGAEALLKATADYWKMAFATLIEEKAQAIGEENGIVSPSYLIQELSKMLMSLDNSAMQEIIDRIPYTK